MKWSVGARMGAFVATEYIAWVRSYWLPKFYVCLWQTTEAYAYTNFKREGSFLPYCSVLYFSGILNVYNATSYFCNVFTKCRRLRCQVQYEYCQVCSVENLVKSIVSNLNINSIILSYKIYVQINLCWHLLFSTLQSTIIYYFLYYKHIFYNWRYEKTVGSLKKEVWRR